MKNGWWVGTFVVVFVAIAGCADNENAPSETSPSMTGSGEHADGHMMGNMTAKEVEMYTVATDLSSTPGTWFRFRPDAFEAKVGNVLNVTLKAAVGNTYPHSLVIDELTISLGPVQAGAAVSTVLALDKPGTYIFYCAEGNHQQLGMEGTLTVT